MATPVNGQSQGLLKRPNTVPVGADGVDIHGDATTAEAQVVRAEDVRWVST